MKKLTLVSLILTVILASCKEYGEVRIMPELNNYETEVELYKNEGSSKTVVISTTAEEVTAEYDASWLSVDANKRRIIYTAVALNDTGESRSTIVKLNAGEFSTEVTVTQLSKDESEMKALKVGQLTEDGLGMVFWVDPNNKEIGKAISLERWGGSPFESSIMAHGALSLVDGPANTALYLNAAPTDAAALCTALGDGWYLPASNELLDLFTAYNGVSNTDPSFTNANPDAISDKEKAARAAFDKMLTDLQGTVINAAAASGAGESYWSSTESEDGTKSRYVRYGKYALDLGAKTGTTRYVRAMKVIGDYKFPEEPATLSVSPSQVDLTSETGATKEVTVKTNKQSYAYTLEGEDITWLKHEQSGDKVTFTALSANTSDKTRTVTITFTAGSGDNQATAVVTVSQEKVPTVAAFQIGEYVTKDGGVNLAEGGIVFWAEGNEAKILSLKRSEAVSWITDAAAAISLGLTDANDGEVNTQKMKNSAVADKISILQDCKDGWYLPAINEMNEVFKAYNGGSASANDLKPNDITPEEKLARAAWDKILTDHQGIAMNLKDGASAGDEYMTSTEGSDATKIYFVRIGAWAPDKLGAKYMSKPTRYMRLVRKVSK